MANSVTADVQEATTWSIVLSVLMMVAGVLAIPNQLTDDSEGGSCKRTCVAPRDRTTRIAWLCHRPM